MKGLVLTLIILVMISAPASMLKLMHPDQFPTQRRRPDNWRVQLGIMMALTVLQLLVLTSYYRSL